LSPGSSPIDLRFMQAAALLQKDPLSAARIAAELLAIAPGRTDIAMLLGAARRAAGNPEAAAQVFAALTAAQPDAAVIQLELARTLVAQADVTAARATLELALRLQPNLAEGWRELSLLYAQANDPDRCDKAYARYVTLVRPGQQVSEAGSLLASGRLVAAQAILAVALRAMPQDVFALRLSAEIAALKEDYPEAERLLREALRIAPGYSEARLDLVRVYRGQQIPEAMLPLLERLLRLEPSNLQYRLLKSAAFNLLGLNDASLEVLEQLREEYPQDERVWVQYGHALRAGGSLAKAIEAYRHITTLAPQAADAWFSLSNLKTVRLTDTDIATMSRQLEQPGLSADARLRLEFALGKAHEDAGRFSNAFEHYSQGNAVRRTLIRYDAEQTSQFVGRNQQLYTHGFFAARVGWGAQAGDPIFVVGLPRSGSTLVEQILASHSQVEGTRELTHMLMIARDFGAVQAPDGPPLYPQSVAKLTPEQACTLGERYLAEAMPYRRLKRARFIDKMPSNWMHIGLIQLLLPNARIIDARRGPLACGVANFKQHFQQGMWFSYDLADIGTFYRDYVRLMQHFDSVLPERVHRVQYERLVGDLESEVRGLLQFCGLPFEPQCLRFHETQRVVQTVSSEQVRTPLYKEGLDQWRNFEPWLDPLKEALGDLARPELAAAGAARDPAQEQLNESSAPRRPP
jgi:tetratricopeptide (TPR) repeat protein